MQSTPHQKEHLLRVMLHFFLVVFFSLFLFRTIELLMASGKEPDAILVLGGTPNREKHAAKLMLEHPERKALISGGSEDPCIWLMFDKAQAPKENVWMEHASRNTFENFIYSAPILKSWGASKVLLITDKPQNERALPMAQIMLGAKGMLVQLEMVPNSGGPESSYPLWLEIILSSVWALASQVIEPYCQVNHLPDTDMRYWYDHEFFCLPQAEVDHYRPKLK